MITASNPKEFWRKIGKIGVGNERQNNYIPMEVKLSDGSLCNNQNVVIDTWKNSFCDMLNQNHSSISLNSNHVIFDEFLDNVISKDEVYKVLNLSKNGKSPGIDDIQVELFKINTALNALTRIFNICYDSGKIPSLWSKGMITPIPKLSTSDPHDPMSYRGITLDPSSYKLYCGVLNARLTSKLDDLDCLNDEQNGFRKDRSTIDHLYTLTTIIESRKLKKLSTFCAFIDFKKAYDWVNRGLLFTKLESLGISSKMLKALHAIYNNNRHVREMFDKEKITPNSVSMLSKHELEYLGVTIPAHMMTLVLTSAANYAPHDYT
ncbi:unnamed protein product [Mytilus edulis]|uniref:Reverse transcriptase domain-containing protein n=1 Tax=Mytilus edulis TaxID=6550 RepID=A0A8S3TEN8_MYTED|nr:unnamed protein product [Mytilus edulis]